MRSASICGGLFAALLLSGAQRGEAQAQAGPERAPGAAAQETGNADPASALADVLSAACRADEAAFANSFTADNSAAFRALPEVERKRLMERFSLSDAPGKPLLSADQDNHIVLRCETAGGDNEFRFGAARVRENLAFIPVSVVNSQSAEFGLVREAGSWKLLSLGLVLLDIKQLAVQWAEADLEERENNAATALRTLGRAIDSYNRTFGKLPDSLTQLGPGPKNQVTPDRASLVSAALAEGSDGGYRFRYRVTLSTDNSTEHYVIEAVPENYGTTGRTSFFRDVDGKIHGADDKGAAATADDPLLPEGNAQ
jgi:hypothetical protein